MVDLGDRIMWSPVGAELVRARLEVRLENGFEHQLQACLDHPVSDGRNPKFPELAGISLRYHHPPHLTWRELARFQQVPDMAQECLDPDPGFHLGRRDLRTRDKII